MKGTISGTAITVPIPAGTGLTNLIPTIIHTGVSVSPASGTAQNFTKPVEYTVTAEDGSTAVYTVTVIPDPPPLDAKAITGFSFASPPAIGTIDGTNITVTVPFGTDLTSLTPTITIAGVSVSPESETAQDFSSPVTYTVTAGDNTSVEYTVTVSVSSSDAKEITGFSFAALPAQGTINGTNITVTVPFDTVLTSLTPTITHTGVSVSPPSGEVRDFSSPVTYTVTAGDNTSVEYTVTVSLNQASGAKEITGFSFASPQAAGTISGTNITVTVPFDTVLTSLTPTITHTGVSVSPPSGEVRDFSSPVTYTVTAGDNTSVEYTVTVIPDPPPIDAKVIMGFSFVSPPAIGTIDGTNITVTVPFGTDLTSLTPTITIAGVSVSPASGTAQDFSSPVTYTVTAEDNSTAVYTVRVRDTILIDSDTIASAASLLTGAGGGSSAEAPLKVEVKGELNSIWASVLEALGGAGKYADLDLSACTGKEFNLGGANDGEKYIVSLVLPDTMRSIKDGNYSSFYIFSALRSVRGDGIQTIGNNAFIDCASLASVDFPEATSIGENAFGYCPALTTVNLPKAESFGMFAFYDCTALKTITLPKAKSFKTEYDLCNVFKGCTTLTTVDLPNLITLDGKAFEGCPALTTISLLKLKNLCANAFEGCTALTTINLPEATSIGDSAFSGCTALEEISLPAVKNLGVNAFKGCTALATLFLPDSPPSLGSAVFQDTRGGTIPTLTIQVSTQDVVTTYQQTWKVSKSTDEYGFVPAYGDNHKTIVIAGSDS